MLLMDVYGREHPLTAIQHAQCEGWLETYVINFKSYVPCIVLCYVIYLKSAILHWVVCSHLYSSRSDDYNMSSLHNPEQSN